MRIQIPAYTDRWMTGDRYGLVLSVRRARRGCGINDLARVKLDISGKIIRVILDDCTIVES